MVLVVTQCIDAYLLNFCRSIRKH